MQKKIKTFSNKAFRIYFETKTLKTFKNYTYQKKIPEKIAKLIL